MPEMGESSGLGRPPAVGVPAGRPLPCSTCGGPVDPLRAARVAIFRERFRYFCSAECRERFSPEGLVTPVPVPRKRTTPVTFVSSELVAADPAQRARHQVAEALQHVAGEPSDELSTRRSPSTTDRRDVEEAELKTPLSEDLPVPPDVGSVLLLLAMIGGGLAVALLLAGGSAVALSARTVMVIVACAALIAEYVMGPHDPTDAHPLALLAAPCVAAAAALVARLMGDPRASSAVTLAGLIIASTAAGVWLTLRARRSVELERDRIAGELDCVGHRVVGDDVVSARAADLRPGEEIVVEAGEVVPVDATVSAGSASVLPWLGAKTPAPRAEGDPIAAGALVVEGRLRAVVGWAGHDRAWMRLTNDPRRRADVLSPPARAGRMIAERLAPFAAGLAALTAFANEQDTLGIVLFAVSAQAALASAGIAQMGALHVARGVLAALQRGIAFRTADAFDRAGRVSVAAFCARGTLLLGEPEVASIEPIGEKDPERVLSLLAGAESGANHPVAAAVLRAARARGVRPDGVRSPTVQPGLGVTAIASNGQPLVVGNRALMLREKISVAIAESKIVDLEAMGRSVLLVALGARLVGVVGLQDGLRPGSRAAVQHLLDVGVEPVLLSGDARETCEALGRALDIEHIRPELLPAERGDEIRRLVDAGAVVAVVGRSSADDASLAAADVSIALAIAGSSVAEWSVQLASDDVRDAAWAVRLAHRCRDEARIGVLLVLAPSAAAVLAVAFALVPPVAAPLSALAGTIAALLRWRAQTIAT
jgi:P-type Cu+ transporter